MKLVNLFVAFLFLCLLIGQASALPWETPTTHQWYMRADTHTVNNQLGYVLNRTQTSTERNVSSSTAGSVQVWWAIRVLVLRSNNSTVTLTNGYDLNVTRSSDGSGLQNTTFTPADTPLYIGSDAIQMNLYIKMGANDYQLKAVFVSAHLETDQINNATWTVRLYTNRTVSGSTYGTFFWGDSAHPSRIENVEVDTLKPWETMTYHLHNQDFISFIVTPWTYFIGNLFYGMGLLFVGVTLYNKYEDPRPVIIIFWIFGGTGGVLTMLIPAVGLHLSWFLLSFALATTLYVLFR